MESLAELLAVEVSFVRRLVAERRVPYFKFGRYVRFDRHDVARWMESQRIAGAGERSGQREEVR